VRHPKTLSNLPVSKSKDPPKKGLQGSLYLPLPTTTKKFNKFHLIYPRKHLCFF
jgi:hypothetical protein